MKRRFKDDFNVMAMLLISVGVAINLVGFQIASVLRLPIFLDTIGTILIGVIAGPWVAVLAGLVTNLINGIFNPIYFPYAIVSVAIGFGTGLLSKKGMFKNIPKALISAIIITFIAIITSAPITVLVFGGATGNTSALITATFLAAGQEIWGAVFSSTFISEVADKIVSVLIVYYIVQLMSDRYLSKLNYGHLYMKRNK
ncbi:ECF transporter S component [Radiobacillus kanasensis]|uniref:ECF transporter S component n=1 Tax=Radiobacillus kanasensis TaxID=2844358 RepID=UPI001E393865|nr:ECF transporter S component [Radiobacillus kanasensis]UFT98701.1 ECF transporter S component [Radiobacillus kanasensis]